MEVSNIDSHLKYVNFNGVTLNIDERLQLDLSLQRLATDFKFDEILFWGKVTGTVKDYYVAIGLNYVGFKLFPSKQYFWASSNNFVFASLPEVSPQWVAHFDKMNSYFTGEYDRVIVKAVGPGIVIDHTTNLVMPPKNVTELDRLSYVIHQIENDCQVVPKGAMKFTPLREVRRNEAFKGLRKDDAFDIANYQHFRQNQQRDKIEQIDRDDGVYNHEFLDDISVDFPKSCWSILKDSSESVAIVRNQLWPGYFGYHRICSAVYGGIYYGNGIKNTDLPFML